MINFGKNIQFRFSLNFFPVKDNWLHAYGRASGRTHNEENSRFLYSRINSTKFSDSGTGIISQPRLVSQVGRVREIVCT